MSYRYVFVRFAQILPVSSDTNGPQFELSNSL